MDKLKCMLIYPPGPMYQRGEDRSQGNVSGSAATVMRAPNDMGYASAILKKKNFDVYFCDYQTEKRSLEDLLLDFCDLMPDLLIVSITNSTIFQDVEVVNTLKSHNKQLKVVLKGAMFFDAPEEVLKLIDLSNVDYLIGGEIEFAIGGIADYCFFKTGNIDKVPGILFKNNQNDWCKNYFGEWNLGVDDLPFPDRSIINNALYVRPDNGKAQATIVTSRGCPAACVYCLTPIISGKRVRFRSPGNILEELKECYYEYGISEFFFRSDTFTIDHSWVSELCDLIISSELHGKISWVANSRVKPLHDSTLAKMKEAGCWLVAFGFESGDDLTLKKMKKGATVKDNVRACQLAKQAGLKVYGFFMVGFPWEDWSNLNNTKLHIYNLDADFIELHLALPYHGTELYNMTVDAGTLKSSVLGRDYFEVSTTGTNYISSKELLLFKSRLIIRYHLRPRYIAKKLAETIRNPRLLQRYFLFGTRLIFNNLYFRR